MRTLDDYLQELRAKRHTLILESVHTGDVVSLARLVQWADIRVCCSPTWHRPHYRYAGHGRFVCEVCERIEVA